MLSRPIASPARRNARFRAGGGGYPAPDCRDACCAVFDRWGFSRVITPAFEYEDVLALGLGSAGRAAAIRFVEPSSGQVVALPPDITPQIARLIATRFRDEAGPLRLSYEGTVVRLDQRARSQREIIQAGVEMAGVAGPRGDAEIVALARRGAGGRRLRRGRPSISATWAWRARCWTRWACPRTREPRCATASPSAIAPAWPSCCGRRRGPQAGASSSPPCCPSCRARRRCCARRSPGPRRRPAGIRQALRGAGRSCSPSCAATPSRRVCTSTFPRCAASTITPACACRVTCTAPPRRCCRAVVTTTCWPAMAGRRRRSGFAIDVEATAGALEQAAAQAAPGDTGGLGRQRASARTAAGTAACWSAGRSTRRWLAAQALRRDGRRAAVEHAGPGRRGARWPMPGAGTSPK